MGTLGTDQPLSLDLEIQDFLLDRQVRNLAKTTIQRYSESLAKWRSYMVDQGVTATVQVTPSHMRRFLLTLTEHGHNPGGVSHLFRPVKTYLRWFGEEYAPPGWRNPLDRVKPPHVSTDPIPPVELKDIHKMLATCEAGTLTGERDKAVLLLLLDTGVRHQELTDLVVGDVDLATGTVLVRNGKGRKSRVVFVGARTRRALLAYLRQRSLPPADAPLWVSREGMPLGKYGMRQIVRRRAESAGVEEPGMHAFRRAFAVNSLRNGMDVITLQRLMGHTTLAVINRYLALVDDDLRASHQKFGVVDNMTK